MCVYIYSMYACIHARMHVCIAECPLNAFVGERETADSSCRSPSWRSKRVPFGIVSSLLAVWNYVRWN